MSNTVTTATPATDAFTATPATDAFTVTAEIEVTQVGTAYLRVTVDGERIGFEISPHSLRLRKVTVTEEAERLLQRHAGYRAATVWASDDQGHLSATVAEITGRCTTCIHGCTCQLGDTGCGHYRCPAATELANTCDGAALALTAKRTYPYAPRKAAKRNR